MIRTIILLGAVFVAAVGFAGPSSAGDHAPQSRETYIALEFLKALGRLEFDAASSFMGDDAILDLPYAGQGLTLHGRDKILQFFKSTMAGSVASIEYELDRAYPSPETAATVLEISTQGRTASGVTYTNRLIAVFEFRDGKITLFREYFNPNRTK